MTTPTGKGRPTPKRSESTKRRTGPVAPPPQNRKEAAQRRREQAIESRQRVKDGQAKGEDRYLAGRDAGPVRALVRDTVDVRRNLGVLLLPLALILVAAQLSANERLISLAFTVWAAVLLAVFADTILTGGALKRAIREAFPDETKLRAHVGYGLLRSTVLRRFRLPKPRVSPPKFGSR